MTNQEILKAMETGVATEENQALVGNEIIEEAIAKAEKDRTPESYCDVFKCIEYREQAGGNFLTGGYIKNPEAMGSIDFASLKKGGMLRFMEDIHIKPLSFTSEDGRKWLAVFTSTAEYKKNTGLDVQISHYISDILREAVQLPDMDGIIINPRGTYFIIPKDILEEWLEIRELADKYDENGKLP